MTEKKGFTTGIRTVKMEPETAKIIWVRVCRACKAEFRTDDPKKWVCDGCLKTYEFELGGLRLVKRVEDGVKSD